MSARSPGLRYRHFPHEMGVTPSSEAPKEDFGLGRFHAPLVAFLYLGSCSHTRNRLTVDATVGVEPASESPQVL